MISITVMQSGYCACHQPSRGEAMAEEINRFLAFWQICLYDVDGSGDFQGSEVVNKFLDSTRIEEGRLHKVECIRMTDRKLLVTVWYWKITRG